LRLRKIYFFDSEFYIQSFTFRVLLVFQVHFNCSDVIVLIMMA